MTIRFVFSGTILAESSSDRVPSVGDEVTIRTGTYKKGLEPGTLISFIVSDEFPPHYDYSAGGEPVIYIDVNNYTVRSGQAED
ncbi:hypothetical protein Q3V30_22155 (plasmid) [Erwinia pyri]|uniref:Uncharacterized protein n=1 Tax=Erwinia pyri TaxID=3062598 RepID=A0AA50DNT5_9GAMM|nr:hypothetical protein [Erwinia sp. DE2]WLS81162.1 hypothetical protein Q3V30_22155 [Erwinia sp. DE2]